MNDVARFMLLSLAPDVRRANEDSLPALYGEELGRHGVTQSDESRLSDYRAHQWLNIGAVVIAVATLDVSTEQARHTVAAFGERIGAALESLGDIDSAVTALG